MHNIVMKLVRLEIKRPASWRVLLTIIGEAATGTVARLQIRDICGFTGLCERTVKSAIGELIETGIIVRVVRVGAFSVPMLQSPGLPARPPFTAKQGATVRKALREAGALLGVDPVTIVMPTLYCEMVGLDPGITFSSAFEIIRAVGDRDRARRFVGMVLEFRYCEWVGGRPAL